MICPQKTLAVFLGLFLAIPIPAALPQQEDPRARIRTTVELVVVPVTVKDGTGNLVSDLREGEFRIFEDGVEQQISLFSVEAFPLSAVVLLDDGLRKKAAEQLQKSLASIAAGFSPSDEVSIFQFDEVPRQVSDFITDNDALFSALKRLDLSETFPGRASGPMTAGPRINAAPAPGAPGVTRAPLPGRNYKHIDDAVYAAAEILQGRARERRKIIFLVSDGLNSRNNTYSFDDTLRLLLSADISLYAIGVGEAVLSRGAGVLSKYARATGGDSFHAATLSDLEALYAQVTDEVRNQYTLGYVPTSTDRKHDYHSLEVRVRRPNLTLLARDGYYLSAKP